MKVGRFCINWRVLAVLGAIGVGILLLAPNMGRSVLPVLLLAACPLSMIFMMRAMHGDQSSKKQEELVQAEQTSSNDEIGELKARLARTQAEQDAIAREIAAMQAGAVTAEAEAALEKSRAPESPDGNAAG